jgi:hypothetical protein
MFLGQGLSTSPPPHEQALAADPPQLPAAWRIREWPRPLDAKLIQMVGTSEQTG